MITTKVNSEFALFKNITGTLLSKEDGGDIIEQIKYYVEGLDFETAQLCVQKCSDVRGFSVFLLGGILQAVNENKWYVEYGYSSFLAMLEQGLGLSQSAAYDYMKIYRCLIDSGVSWEQIEHVGWTKVRWFAKHLTQNNVDQWVQEAEARNVAELKKFIQQEYASVAGKAILPKYDPTAVTEVSTQVDNLPDGLAANQSSVKEDIAPALITEASSLETLHNRQFKLYPLQEASINDAISKAKEELPTPYENEALAAICLGYVVGNSPLEATANGAKEG